MHTDQLSLAKTLEAILFWKGEPQSVNELAKYLKATPSDINEALNTLEENLKDRGIVLMRNGDEVMLGTSPSASSIIESITKEELSKDLGRAALETLSIILYKGPLKRSEVDYIRGVNSTFIIRNLLVRGLIQKQQSVSDQRAPLYAASFDLLSHLGLTNVKELPEFEEVQDQIRQFKESHEQEKQPDPQQPEPENNAVEDPVPTL